MDPLVGSTTRRPHHETSDDHGAVTFGWLGKSVAYAILMGVPSIVCVGIYMAIRVASIEAQQAQIIESIRANQEAVIELTRHVRDQDPELAKIRERLYMLEQNRVSQDAVILAETKAFKDLVFELNRRSPIYRWPPSRSAR